MSVFSHTAMLEGFENFQNARQIRQDVMDQIFDESRRNPLVRRGEVILQSRVLSQGYTIEFSEKNYSGKINDDFVDNILNRHWTPELKKGISHALNIGFYVVQYVKANNVATKNGKFVWKPFVMHPEDYVVYCSIDPNTERQYVAYYRKDTLKETPIPNSRVMIVFPPDSDGVVQSPVQSCYEQLITFRQNWENYSIVDWKNTFPLQYYYISEKEQKLVPNQAPPTALAAFEDRNDFTPGSIGIAQYQAGQALEMTQKIMGELENSTRVVEEEGDYYNTEEKYDPVQRKYVQVARSDPSLPYKVLTPGLRVDNGVARSHFNPNFLNVNKDLVVLIASCLGIPADFLIESSNKFAANFELSREVMNNTTTFWQNVLEEHIVTMYLDIYYEDHAAASEEIFSRAKSVLKNEDEDTDEELEERLQSEKQDYEAQSRISVHFTSNPLLSVDDVKFLKDELVISRETYTKLLMNIYKLPLSDALTDKQMEKEMQNEAKRQKMINDILSSRELKGSKQIKDNEPQEEVIEDGLVPKKKRKNRKQNEEEVD